MKVLHVVHALWMGGAQRLLSDILPLMNDQIEVTLLVTQVNNSYFSKKLVENGIEILSLDVKNIKNPTIPFKIIKFAKQFDLVHVHLFPSLYMVAFASFFFRVPIIYTEHSTYNQRRSKWYMRPIEKIIYSRYKRIISISKYTQNQLKSWLRVKDSDERFVVINNGVDLSSFEHERITKEKPNTLIMISRFAPSKDHKTLLKAMALLPDGIKLILVGDGETMKECKDLSFSLGVDGRVQFVGRQSDIATWINKADIGVQASIWEGFGLTAVEMMAGGIPVVASNVDGLKQVVEGAGVLFPEGDEIALAAIINKLVDDKSYYLTVKKKCEERAKVYDIHTMVDKYLEVYNSFK